MFLVDYMASNEIALNNMKKYDWSVSTIILTAYKVLCANNMTFIRCHEKRALTRSTSSLDGSDSRIKSTKDVSKRIGGLACEGVFTDCVEVYFFFKFNCIETFYLSIIAISSYSLFCNLEQKVDANCYSAR